MNFWTQVWIKVALKNAKTVKELSQTIERVRDLHKRVTEDNYACGDPECSRTYEKYDVCADCLYNYPCPTIKVLDGEQE